MDAVSPEDAPMKKLTLFSIFTASLSLSILLPKFWKNLVSLPILRVLNNTLGALPFSVLEWGILALIFFMLIILIKTGPRAAAIVIGKTILTMATLFTFLWLPLYEKHPPVTATAAQMTVLTQSLIRDFNQNPPDFSILPDDLPGKTAAFPFWMRRMNVSGFYSFLTGEILLSPDLPNALLPFTAVHESVHASGVADEGSCNILAYKSCMEKGGVYASSAKVWALKYALAELRHADPAAFASAFTQMSETTLLVLYAAGGVHEKTGFFLPFSSDYEILARHLAAQSDG